MASNFGRRVKVGVVGAVLVASVGCGGAGAGSSSQSSSENLDLGEASSALVTADEGGDSSAEAASASTTAELDITADEEADVIDAVPDSAGDPCDFKAKRQRILAAYDTNGNGVLDDGERAALKQDLDWRIGPSLRRPRFAALGWRFRIHAFRAIRWAFDEDGSGDLSSDERAQMVSAIEGRCELIHQHRLDQFDTNHDGTLDQTERQAAQAARRAKLQEKYQEVLTKYDLDGNGRLDLTERAQLRADLRAAAKARRDALVAQYDTNGDGKLSTEEALPLRLAIQQRIAEGKSDTDS